MARRALVLICFLFCAAELAAALASPVPKRPWFGCGKHQVIVMSHQGGEKRWPTNTMTAFRSSAALGCDVLDTDIHETSDGVLVCIHDETVDRTTDGRGAVSDFTWDALHKLDAGYRFTADGGKTYPFRSKGVTIASLEELFQAYPHAYYSIELKPAPDRAAADLCALVRKYHLEEHVLFSSFLPSRLRELRHLMPEAASSAGPDEVRWMVIASLVHLEGLLRPDYQALEVPLRHGSTPVVTDRFVSAAHRRGLEVLPWTLDTPEEFQFAMGRGCDGINTNVPDTLLDWLTH